MHWRQWCVHHELHQLEETDLIPPKCAPSAKATGRCSCHFPKSKPIKIEFWLLDVAIIQNPNFLKSDFGFLPSFAPFSQIQVHKIALWLLVIVILQNPNFQNLKGTGFECPSCQSSFQIFENQVLILLIAILQSPKFKISDFSLAEIYTRTQEKGCYFSFKMVYVIVMNWVLSLLGLLYLVWFYISVMILYFSCACIVLSTSSCPIFVILIPSCFCLLYQIDLGSL